MANLTSNLLQELHDKNHYVRRSTALALGEMKNVDAVAELADVLNNDTSLLVRYAAAEALGKIGHISGLPALLTALWDKEVVVRDMAASAIRQLGKAATPYLLDAIANDPHTREAAITALGLIKDAVAVPILITALDDEDINISSAAAKSLGEIGDLAAVPHLCDALQSSDRQMQLATVSALGKLGDASASPKLTVFLHDADWQVRWATVEALGKLGDKSVAADLIPVLQDTNLVVRGTAADVLGEMQVQSAVPSLRNALHDEVASMRWTVAKALGQIKDPSAVADLAEKLSDTEKPHPNLNDERVCDAVARALGHIGTAEALAVLHQWRESLTAGQ